MIGYYTPIIAALKEILPTYHEKYISGAMKTPCYTVQAYGNRDTSYGETVGYSAIMYMIKTWADNPETLETRALQADEEMRRLRFHRTSSQELQYGDLLCNLAIYEAQGYERYFD